MEAALTPRTSAVRTATVPMGPRFERPIPVRDRQTEIKLQLLPADTAVRRLAVVEAGVPRLRSELVTRVVNVAIASVALAATAPILAFVAIMVRVTSPGPVLYSQTRVGVDRRWRRNQADDRRVQDHGGKPFKMWKFRSMCVDAEPNGHAVWAKKQDTRVTLIGSFLRKTRLDELPQLYNVIRGDMNIVGPRPERPSIFAELRENIPEYPIRQRVKPGITGWAQINQAYDSCLDDVRSKVRYDLEYLERQSLGMDLRIMSMTIPVMLLRRGGQ